VPEPLLARIGDVTVSFALVEFAVRQVALLLLRADHGIGRVVTAELSFRALRALIINLYRERHGEDADFESLRSLMGRSDLEGKRNLITHSLWAAGKTKDTVTRIKTTAKERHGVRSELVSVSSDDLRELADDLKQLADDIQRFGISLVEAGKAG
jgi:hypothetical protein